MNLRPFYRLSAVVVAAMLAVAAWGIWRVGPDATVPIHPDATGSAIGYGPAWLSFLLTPFIGAGMGLLFAVLGNVLTTVRSNFLFGVRTPWTLSSELAWDRTHRLVGRMFVVGGLLMVLASLLGSTLLLVALILGFIVAVLVVAVAYSCRVWRENRDRRPIGGAS